jgi:drug/metabolite transporter (DMT)-like permease
MNFIKVILAILGLMFGVMLLFWLIGVVSSLLWYGFWLGLVAAIGYGGYKLFTKAEKKLVGPGNAYDEIGERDYSLSWKNTIGSISRSSTGRFSPAAMAHRVICSPSPAMICRLQIPHPKSKIQLWRAEVAKWYTH